MIKKFLSNGITLVLDKSNSNSVVVEITVKVGSNNENKNNFGVSHFIEHLMFSGTKIRSSKRIASEIESTGGEFNAITTNERTSYYVRVPNKYIIKALDVLSDCIKNSVFDKNEIEKERNIILSELDIYNDSPTIYQWMLFQNKLFKKINAKNPIIGTKETVSKISREEILSYYKKHYTTKNLIITMTGKINNNIINVMEEKFRDFRFFNSPSPKILDEPRQIKKEEYTEKKALDHSYLMIGYKVVGRTSKDNYVLDVIKVILGVGGSSRLFDEIRLKRGLGYGVGAHYEGNLNYGYFVVFVTTEKKNLRICKKILLNEYEKIKNVAEKELEDAKNFIEGQFLLDSEDNFKRADLLSFWELIKDAKLYDSYIDEIKKVTKEDIKMVASKYFHKNYCCVIITK